MKTIYLSFIAMLGACTMLSAQTGRQPIPAGGFLQTIRASQSETHNDARTPSAPTVQYGNDIIIQNAPAIDQRRVRISVAFNGWVYAAYSTYDSAGVAGGITIRSSRDNGMTWTTVDSYSPQNIVYPAFDIVVCGTDTNNLTLYLAGVNHNTTSGNYVLFVDRYNATTGSFIGSNYNLQNGTRRIYDVALASDYRFPAVGASPYSVGLLYSAYSSSVDSMVFLGSVDGGGTWSVRQSVMTTGYYFRNVSLAYGRSASASNGRYFGAWEMLTSSGDRTGHIYTSRSTSTVNDAWIPPVNLDSISSSMINLCCNPEIAVQFNGTDNDSSSVTAVVLCQRDFYGNGTDYDLLGFYNKRAHYTNFWNRLDIVNSGENDLQPDISYDPGYDNFLTVYYDSTDGKLPYCVNGNNLVAPNTWNYITPQYNDMTGNLRAAWPRVEINPMLTQTAHAWIAEGAGSNGVAMFDAEYLTSSISEAGGASITGLFPNPSSSSFTLNYSTSDNNAVLFTVTNTLGEVVETRRPDGSGPGNHTEQFDVSGWANGVYFVTMLNNGKSSTARIVVAHP
ncbi:MAG TPA: T9SS type A sorting domain-containing protein [Bacteroidia bacterium]|nr:T9SS type A sorting domain-containing protein [Bacteroidia bacterium]